MSIIPLNDGHIAMIRGVRNCGKHHEENATAAALQFANECEKCAGALFMVAWNAAMNDVKENLERLRQ